MAQTVAIIPQRRSIGGITANVTIRETYRNDMALTEHPVENNANISDHAYLRPREIELEIGWDGRQNPADVFNQLKQLQTERQPFTIYTDRDTLTNMFVIGIATVTDQRTAYSFIAIVRCRQVNFVSTQSTVVDNSAQAGQPLAGVGAAARAGTGGDFPGSGNSPFNGLAAGADKGTQSLKSGGAVNTQDPSLQGVVPGTGGAGIIEGGLSP